MKSKKTSYVQTGVNGIQSDRKYLPSHFKQFLLCIFLVLIAVTPMFADDASGIGALDSWGKKLLSIFSSGWVKAILLMALIGEAIGIVFMGQNGGGGAAVKKMLPWIIGTIILLSATSIGEFFFTGMKFEVK